MDTLTVILSGGGMFAALAGIDSLTSGHPLTGCMLVAMALLDLSALAAHRLSKRKQS